MPRKTGVQKGSAMSMNITPTLWLRLLRRNRAMAFGRYPSFFATSSMRFFVAGAMYRASGALFSTIETVAGEKPLDVATSLIVTVWFLPLCRFTGMSASAGATIILLESLMMQWAPRKTPASFRWYLKRQRFAEPARFPYPEGNSCDHPDGTDDLSRVIEA